MSGRKRRAPGASPQNAYPQNTGLTADQFNWNDPSLGADTNTFGNSAYDGIGYGADGGGAAGPTHNRIVSLDGLNDDADMSGQLIRRNPNNQLAARRGQWDAFENANQQAGWENADDDEELEQKAVLAKKDALAKRKQIPPFVQKLSR